MLLKDKKNFDAVLWHQGRRCFQWLWWMLKRSVMQRPHDGSYIRAAKNASLSWLTFNLFIFAFVSAARQQGEDAWATRKAFNISMRKPIGPERSVKSLRKKKKLNLYISANTSLKIIHIDLAKWIWHCCYPPRSQQEKRVVLGTAKASFWKFKQGEVGLRVGKKKQAVKIFDMTFALCFSQLLCLFFPVCVCVSGVALNRDKMEAWKKLINLISKEKEAKKTKLCLFKIVVFITSMTHE